MRSVTGDRQTAGEHVAQPGGPGGHGDHAAVFRDRFWLTLALAVPVVVFSGMFQELAGYRAAFPGSRLIAPVLGTVVFCYGGWPFLAGAAAELRGRRPGMMLLIGMAITVAFAASLAASIGWSGVEVWWELALLIAIMLLGHWLEMRAVGRASGALAALAALLPGQAELMVPGGTRPVPAAGLAVGDTVLAIAAIAGRYVSIAAEVLAFALAALGVGAAWLINLDLFSVLAVATRGSAIGVTVTGLMIGGAAYFWQQVLGFFAGLTRKLGDEAASLENDGQLRRVA